MENQTKVNLWTEELLNKCKNNGLVNFNFQNDVNLRMTNYQYDEIFSLLMNGFPLKINELDLTNKTLAQALDDATNEDKQNKKNHIYTADDKNIQREKLKYLLTKDNLILTFGLLDYFDDKNMNIKSAPLVLMPIKLEYIENNNSYQISNINHELYLNDYLINKLIEERRIDISYPLESNFSLIEYFTYVSTKVRNYHFSVNNGCFITCLLNQESFYQYKDFQLNQKFILDLPIVKSISYLNSEFFNFNKVTSSKLYNQYLSLLNLDNDEYKILKRINQRENIVLRTNLKENKDHLLLNVIYDFLLNNKKILITYDDNNYLQVLKFVKDNSLDEYILDLSKNNTNKENIINKFTSKDNLDFDTKLLEQSRIDETVDTYYLLKNDFKKFINALRKNNEPLNLSINKAIDEYYSLDKYPDISIDIPNVNLIDDKQLSEYLQYISSFTSSIEDLKCNYLDHPFYGFNNLNLNQENYQEIKEKITLLSNEFEPSRVAFSNLEKNFSLPYPQTLKSMKCILNIISLIPDLVKIPTFYFEINDFNELFNNLNYHNELFNELTNLRNKIITLYNDKVFLIDYKEMHNQMLANKLSRKIINSYKNYFAKKVKIDETILRNLSNDLDEYYALNDKINSFVKENEKYNEFYNEGIYDLDKLKERYSLIKSFKDYCEYLSSENLSFSYKKLELFNEEKLSLLPTYRKQCQIAFNHILKYINFIKDYFDEQLIDFYTLPLLELENKINKASKNFASINDYLNFYLSLKKINAKLPSLGNELLKYNEFSNYKAIFMKRFYYLYAQKFMNDNPLFKNYLEDSFYKSLENYQDYNKNRLDILNALIKNNLKLNKQNNLLALRSFDIPYLNNLKKEKLNVLPLENFINNAKNMIMSLCPIILMPINEVSSLLYRSNYHFDVNIILANENLLNIDIIPSEFRSDQVIVLDSRLINNKQDNLIYQNNENFLYSALQTLNVINYISSSYKENLLKANNIDVSLKDHLIKKLTNKDLLISKDVSTPYGIIDLLVKTPTSKRPTAVIIDHLNYFSIESSIDSFSKANESLEKLGFANYRIITSTYFQDEEKEFNKLLDFIIVHTVQEKNIHKVIKTKPIMEALFKEYINPKDAYYLIQDKENKQIKDVLLEILNICSPIKKDIFLQAIGSDNISYFSSLALENKISIKNNFIFVNNKEIEFKRARSDKNEIRELDTISNEEIAQGVLKMIYNKDLYIDETIKLILLSLGYKKMNQQQYFRIQNIIGDLIEENKLSNNNDLLHYENNN